MTASTVLKQTDTESRAQMLDGLIAFARADFMCFVELTFGVLHPGKKLIYADYLQLMADLLMRVEEGKYKRVLVNLPPRHMKSMMTRCYMSLGVSVAIQRPNLLRSPMAMI